MWRDDTPLTAEEIIELDEYCKKRNIELVPSLSTFGRRNMETIVKMLRIGKLEFISDSVFEFNASKYSTFSLYKAEHTDELITDGKNHLRIDYKVSGVGSNSCGPELEEKYRLNEKSISFQFAVKPVLCTGLYNDVEVLSVTNE